MEVISLNFINHLVFVVGTVFTVRWKVIIKLKMVKTFFSVCRKCVQLEPGLWKHEYP